MLVVQKAEVGVQFWPWNAINDLVSYATHAMANYPFD